MFGTIKSEKLNTFVNLLIASVCAYIYVFFTNHYLRPTFMLNDQVLLREIISGAYTGTPDGHSIFIMYVFSSFIAFLYRIIGGVNWYDVFMMPIFPICCFLIAWLSSALSKNVFAKVLFGAVSLFAFIDCTTYFRIQNEFTVNAGMFSLVGIMYFTYAALCAKKAWPYYTVSVVCFVFSCFLRRHVFMMILPIVALALFYIFLRKGREVKKSLVPLGVLFCILAVCFGVEHFAYSSQEWKDFNTFNVARADIFDYNRMPDYEANKEFYDELGITEAEFKGLDNGFGLVKDLDADTLQKISVLSKNTEGQKVKEIRADFGNVLLGEADAWFRQPVGFITCLFVGLFILCIILKAVVTRKKAYLLRFVHPFAALMFYLVFALYFIYLGRYPDRISVPMGFCVFAYIFVITVYELKEMFNLPEVSITFRRVSGAVIAVAFAGLLALLVLFVHGKSELSIGNWKWKNQFVEQTELIYQFCYANSEATYYTNANIADLISTVWNQESTYHIPDNLVTTTFWTSGSPLYYEHLNRTGIGDITDKLLSCNNIYFIAYSDESLDWLSELASFYGKEIAFNSVEEFWSPTRSVVTVYEVVAK